MSAGQDGDRKGNYVYDFLVKPLLASILILERTGYPAPRDGLFRRGVATLQTSTGIAFRAAMRRLLAVDVVNHVMRQRYYALVIGSVFHDN